MENEYQLVIGLEIHVQLGTNTKLFCTCSNDDFQSDPNTHICPICMGHPGTLPVPSRKAIEYAVTAGLAFGSEIAHETKFDRKNYFYPDLPKGYQISQYDMPICEGGQIPISVAGASRNVALTRIHMEEDAGKLVHPTGADYSLVDYNRAGSPLIEIVTEPEIYSADEAVAVAKKIQEVVRYVGVSNADMEKGQMRFDVNINVKKDGLKVTEISEVKNLNSFRSLERSVLFEADRHMEAAKAGDSLVHETRGWVDDEEVTVSQRGKEAAHDYRYFPEPDIPTIRLESTYVSDIKRSMPELADSKRNRFSEEYGLNEEEASLLATDKDIASYFENVISECFEWAQSLEGSVMKDESEKQKIVKLASNWVLSELFGLMKKEKMAISDVKISAENFAELVALVYKKEVNSSAGQAILKEMFETGGDPSHIMNEKGLKQVDDIDELALICDAVIAENPEIVESIKGGKEQAIQFLMGQVMAKTKGSANPQKTIEILRKKILG